MTTKLEPYFQEFPASITVCDKDGIILEMNAASEKVFEADGGLGLIGLNVLDCHPEPARMKMQEMLASGCPNIYTIEKKGIKKLIYQSPWYQDGEYAGFIELALPIPFEMPHFVRK